MWPSGDLSLTCMIQRAWYTLCPLSCLLQNSLKSVFELNSYQFTEQSLNLFFYAEVLRNVNTLSVCTKVLCIVVDGSRPFKLEQNLSRLRSEISYPWVFAYPFSKPISKCICRLEYVKQEKEKGVCRCTMENSHKMSNDGGL